MQCRKSTKQNLHISPFVSFWVFQLGILYYTNSIICVYNRKNTEIAQGPPDESLDCCLTHFVCLWHSLSSLWSPIPVSWSYRLSELIWKENCDHVRQAWSPNLCVILSPSIGFIPHWSMSPANTMLLPIPGSSTHSWQVKLKRNLFPSLVMSSCVILFYNC